MPFRLTWEGNDGTFSGPESVVLPLNTQVTVPIAIHARSEGAHSAILRFDHPSIAGPAHRMLSTIVVPFAFTAEKAFTVATELTPPVPGDTSMFVDVPEGVSALTVSSSPGVRLSFISPTRGSWWRAPCPTEPEAGKLTCSIAMPAPGVWEINLTSTVGRTFDPEAASPLKAKPVQVTARILDVALSATPGSVSTDAGAVTIQAQSRLAPITGEIRTMALGSALHRTSTIAAGEQQLFEITVPKGATSLRARVRSVADKAADLDLYLLDCTGPPPASPTPPKEQPTGNKAPMMPDPLCGTRAKADDPGAGGEVEITNPAAGRWVVVIDAFAVPSGRTAFEYFDVFTHPMFGTLAVADATTERRPQDQWTVKGHVWVAERPTAQRRLQARIVATSSSVTQPVRVGEGFDVSAVRYLPVPVGSFDLELPDPSVAGATRPRR
jgi:hypothetical protein